MPKPLPQNVTVVPSPTAPLERQPLAAMIACIASLSGTVEREMAGILSDVMEEHSTQALAMYLVLSGSQARKSALLAAAKLRIDDDDYKGLVKLYKKINNRAWDRNVVIHGAWAVHDAYPSALLLCDPGEYAHFEAAANDLVNTWVSDESGGSAEFAAKLSRIRFPQYVIYEWDDFKDIADQLGGLLTAIREYRQKLRAKYRLQSPPPLTCALGALSQPPTPTQQQHPDEPSPA